MGQYWGMPKKKIKKMDRDLYEAELHRLQAELVEMQEWVRATGARLVVIFEGRDAAGKGGAIKRITEFLNPRVARIVALPAPTERQRTQWYFQRYIEHLPAAGEIRLFDRSWYNRGGVERVMGYCTTEEHRRFLRQCPIFERMLIEDGIILRKYWFSVSDKEQTKRFKSRLTDPMRRWKLSPTDLESITRWEDYSRAKDEMFVHTDIDSARWNVVESEDKRKARINMIHHLLSSIPYEHIDRPELKFPKRPPSTGYRRTDRKLQFEVPDHAASVEQSGAADKYIDIEDEGWTEAAKLADKARMEINAASHSANADLVEEAKREQDPEPEVNADETKSEEQQPAPARRTRRTTARSATTRTRATAAEPAEPGPEENETD